MELIWQVSYILYSFIYHSDYTKVQVSCFKTVGLSQEPFKDKTLRALNFEERNKNCDWYV